MWLQKLHALERRVLSGVLRFFRIKQTPEQIARGFAVGLLPNFFPTFGLGFLASAFLARMARGSVVAGVLGGLSLTFVWPLLFFLNVKTGSLLIHPRILIEDLDDVTEKNIQALLWGPAFTVGAVLNGLLAAGLAYLVILLFYQKLRPWAVSFVRRRGRGAREQLRRLLGRKTPDEPRKGG